MCDRQELRKLEAWLGVTLFVHTVRKLQPTEDTSRHWEQIEPVLQQVDEAYVVVQGRGRVAGAYEPATSVRDLPARRQMPNLTRRFPSLKLT